MFSHSYNWYAAYTYPQHERKVVTHLAAAGVNHFHPTYTTMQRWRNRQTVAVSRPLFPGYVFVQIDLRDRLRILRAPGVACLVGFGGAPVPLPDKEMEILRNRLCPLKIEPHPFIHVGDRVRVTSGALAGLEGILLQKKGRSRLVVGMHLIQQAMSVEIDSELIEFVSRQRHSDCRTFAGVCASP